MNAIDDEAGSKTFFRELIPNVILCFVESGMGGVAKMSGHGCAGIDGGFDLIAICFGVTNARHYALANDSIDISGVSGHSGEMVMRRIWPSATSCQRLNSAIFGGRMCSKG